MVDPTDPLSKLHTNGRRDTGGLVAIEVGMCEAGTVVVLDVDIVGLTVLGVEGPPEGVDGDVSGGGGS